MMAMAAIATNYNILASRIKDRRQLAVEIRQIVLSELDRLGLTDKEVETYFGICKATIRNWREGKTVPLLTTVTFLLDRLNLRLVVVPK